MQEVYEYLEILGIKTTSDVPKKIGDLKKSQQIQVIEYIKEILPIGTSIKKSFFNFIASSDLGGEITRCSSSMCRVKQASKLSRFSALYVDSVLIPSPFDKYRHTDVSPSLLIGDIQILLEYRPLLENGIMGFANTYNHICSKCLLSKVKFGDNITMKIEELQNFIDEEYNKNIKVVFVNDIRHPQLIFQSSKKYLPHGSSKFIIDDITRDRIISLLGDPSASNTVLPNKLVLQDKIIRMITRPVFEDIIMQNIWVNGNDLTYLTDRSVDVDIVNKMLTSQQIEHSNRMLEGLLHTLPIIDNAPLNRSVELRVEDGESFQVYRDALNTTISTVREKEEKYYRQACRDIILPEINKINRTLKHNKKNLVGSIAIDIIFASTIASVGLFSGLIPTEIGAAISAIGGAKFGNDIKNKVEKISSGPDSVKENNYYFLWKIQKDM